VTSWLGHPFQRLAGEMLVAGFDGQVAQRDDANEPLVPVSIV
jgi:hypothetical protein